MNKRYILFLLAIFSISSLSAQDVPEVQQSLISKIAATWCPPCGGWGWSFFHELEEDNHEKALLIAVHHSGDLVNPTASAFTTNFGSNSQPRFILGNIDQSVSSGNTATKRTAIQDMVNTNYTTAPVVNTGLTAYMEDDLITVETNTKFFQDAMGAYFVGLYVIEDDVVNYQASIGQGAIHSNVLRTSLTTEPFGEQLSIDEVEAGTEYPKSFSIDVNPNWNLANLTIAAIVWKLENGKYTFVNTNSTDTFEDPAPVSINNIVTANWDMNIRPTIYTGSAEIQINLPAAVDLFQIKMYNQLGQLIETLHNSQLTEGQHSFSVSANLARGIYFVSSSNGNMVETKRLVVQ